MPNNKVDFPSGTDAEVKRIVGIADQVDSFDLSHNRIGILRNRVVWVKEGDVNAGWIENVAYNVDQFQVTDTLIAVLRNGILDIKRGNPAGGDWVHAAEDVDHFQITDNRIGVVRKVAGPGRLDVHEGPVGTGNWTYGVVDKNVDKFQITDTLIAVLRNGLLDVKRGNPAGGDWVHAANDVDQFQITDNRIGVVRKVAGPGRLDVHEGPVGTGNWTYGVVDKNVEGLQMADTYPPPPNIPVFESRIGILRKGVLSVKQGAANVGWTDQEATGVDYAKLTANRIGILRKNILWVKDGPDLNGPWNVTLHNSILDKIADGIAQFVNAACWIVDLGDEIVGLDVGCL